MLLGPHAMNDGAKHLINARADRFVGSRCLALFLKCVDRALWQA
jgi:hypothetical protein